MLTGHGFTTSHLVDTKAGSCAISDVESSLSDQSHASSVNEQHSLMRQQEGRTSRRGLAARGAVATWRMQDDKNCDTGHRRSDMDDLT
jgi:hypothetical protein